MSVKEFVFGVVREKEGGDCLDGGRMSTILFPLNCRILSGTRYLVYEKDQFPSDGWLVDVWETARNFGEERFWYAEVYDPHQQAKGYSRTKGTSRFYTGDSAFHVLKVFLSRTTGLPADNVYLYARKD